MNDAELGAAVRVLLTAVAEEVSATIHSDDLIRSAVTPADPEPALARAGDSWPGVSELEHDANDPRTHDWRTLYDDRTRTDEQSGMLPGWSCRGCDGPPEPKEPDMSGHCLCHDAAVCPDETAGSVLDDRD